jgi:large subunit ribosomal protein L10
VLLSKLAGAMKASMSQAVSLFAAPLSQAARTVDALRIKAEADPSIIGGAGVAAAAAPAEAAPAEAAPAEAAPAEESLLEKVEHAVEDVVHGVEHAVEDVAHKVEELLHHGDGEAAATPESTTPTEG